MSDMDDFCLKQGQGLNVSNRPNRDDRMEAKIKTQKNPWTLWAIKFPENVKW